MIDPTKENVVEVVYRITNGIGVDNSFDAVGSTVAIEACINATRNGGTTTLVGAGALDQTIPLPPPVIWTLSEKKLIGSTLGSCYGRRDIPRFIQLWRTGRLDLEGMITARRPLAEVNQAMADMTAGVGLRTVLTI